MGTLAEHRSPGYYSEEGVPPMTKALEQAFKEASKLAESEQDSLAAAIQAEIEAEEEWESRLPASADALERRADEAFAEHRSGRTRPLDPEER